MKPKNINIKRLNQIYQYSKWSYNSLGSKSKVIQPQLNQKISEENNVLQTETSYEKKVTLNLSLGNAYISKEHVGVVCGLLFIQML